MTPLHNYMEAKLVLLLVMLSKWLSTAVISGKVVHTVVASGQDPRVSVLRRLFNYRHTPQPFRGKTPAELMIRRQVKTS